MEEVLERDNSAEADRTC